LLQCLTELRGGRFGKDQSFGGQFLLQIGGHFSLSAR